MTVRGRSWTKTPQDEKMLISSKTRVECTAETLLPRRRARVGGLCGFRSPAERIPPRAAKPDVAPPCRIVAGMASAKEGRLRAVFGRGRSRKRQGRTKLRGRVRPRSGHICPPCGQFRRFARGVVERAKIALVGSQFEKSPPFQGKRRGCTKNA